MKKLETIGSKISELSKDLLQLIKEIPPYYIQQLNEISEICELQNRVASLSNSRVADVLMYTIKQIAYTTPNPNHEIVCGYLKQAIKDLESGMDAADMLNKYDEIYYHSYRW